MNEAKKRNAKIFTTSFLAGALISVAIYFAFQMQRTVIKQAIIDAYREMGK